MRLVGLDGVRVSELPARSGIGIEAMRSAVGILVKRGYVVLGPDPARARGKMVRLTEWASGPGSSISG